MINIVLERSGHKIIFDCECQMINLRIIREGENGNAEFNSTNTRK